LVTGEALFARSTVEATLDAVLHAEIPPPSSRVPGLAPAIDEACLRALARDPAARYPSAGAMRAAINRHLYSLEAPPGAASLSRLIARWCPPDGGRRDPGAPVGRAARSPDDGAIDRTRPVPGRRPRALAGRAPTVETFATSVHLD